MGMGVAMPFCVPLQFAFICHGCFFALQLQALLVKDCKVSTNLSESTKQLALAAGLMRVATNTILKAHRNSFGEGLSRNPPFLRIVENKFSTMSWLSRDVNRNRISSVVSFMSCHNCVTHDMAKRHPSRNIMFFTPTTRSFFNIGKHDLKKFLCPEFSDKGL